MEALKRLTLRPTEAPRQARRQAGKPGAGKSGKPGPIVKWAGGKTRILEDLLERRPGEFGRYYEPFLGGGAMFFRLAPENATLSDLNPNLINTYRCVAWHVEAVIKRLRVHKREHCQEYYYDMRERWNQGRLRSDVVRAAAFIYLNKTCFNGLYRVNRRGQFNVPMGRYSNPTICEDDKLRTASRVLQRADITHSSFDERIDDAVAGDFVYFDPPYDPVTRTASFTSYTSASFDGSDQRHLADVVGDLTRRGVQVMVSSSDTPYVRELYRDYQIDRIDAPRAINSRASARGAVSELVITNGYR